MMFRNNDFPERGTGSLKVLLRIVITLIFGLMLIIPANAAELSWDALLLQSKGYFEAEEYQKALNYGKQVLTMAEKLYGPEHISTAASMFNLAEIYRMLGNYNNSESHYFGTLRIRERILGREHSHVAACYIGLAEIMMERGEYQLAKKCAEQALAIFEKTNGPDNVETGNVFNILAEVNKGQLQYQEAESFAAKALEIFEKAAGPDSLLTGKALIVLASVRIKQENYSEALSLLQKADFIYMKVYRKKRLDTGKLLYYQAETLRLQGEPKKAQGLYKKALKYYEKRSKNNPDLGKTLVTLAACRKSDLKYIKAEKLHRQGLTIIEGSLGSQSINLEEPIREMVELLVFNRNYQQAGPLAYQLSEIREQIYGTKDLKVASALNRLAGVYLKSNRINEAELFAKQAINIADSAGGSGNSEKAASLLLLVKVKIQRGDYPAAQSDWEQSSGLIKQSSEKKPLLSIGLLETESLLNMAQGKYLAAEPILQKAIAEAEGFFGLLHPELAELLNQLSALYKKQGRIKEAEAVEKRIKKIYSKIS